MELGEGLGDFERDDEQGEREAEDDVGEAVYARHLGAAQAEAVLGVLLVRCLHSRADSVSGAGVLRQGRAVLYARLKQDGRIARMMDDCFQS